MSNDVTISNGGKTVTMNNQYASSIGKANTARNTGKWYFELTQDGGGTASPFGLCSENHVNGNYPNAVGGIVFYALNGNLYVNGAYASTASWSGTAKPYTIGFAVDCDNKTVALYRNGAQIMAPTSYGSVSSSTWMVRPMMGSDATPAHTVTGRFDPADQLNAAPNGYTAGW